MSFFSVLTLIFVVLKLTGVIQWSWLVVIIPSMIDILIIILIVVGTIWTHIKPKKKKLNVEKQEKSK